MTVAIIDTNVMVVANGGHPDAGDECQLACVIELEKLKKHGLLVVDDAGYMFEEYFQQLSLAGRPGVGNAFFKYMYDNQYHPDKFERVTITENELRVFEEFPDDDALIAFDRSDRKFVAAAIASANRPVILNAVDNDWREHSAALARHVQVHELCEQLLPEIMSSLKIDPRAP